MTTENANPSINPADWDTLTGTFRHILTKWTQRMDGVTPATVVAYDRTTNPPRAQITPGIAMVNTNGQQVAKGNLNVPVARFGCGTAFIDFPLKAGDTGLLIACDNDISLFLQNGGVVKPNTARMKSFSDGFFLPLVLKGATVDPSDLDYLTVQNINGSIRIALLPDGAKITGNLYVDGNIEASGTITQGVSTLPPG